MNISVRKPSRVARKHKITTEIRLIFFFLNLSNRKEDGNDVKNLGKKN